MGLAAISLAIGAVLLAAALRLRSYSRVRQREGMLILEWPTTRRSRLHRKTHPRHPGLPPSLRAPLFLRDPSVVFAADQERCDLLFFKPKREALEDRIIGYLTASSGLSGVAADCGWQAGAQVYVASSGCITRRRENVDLPHFSALVAFQGAPFARVPLNRVLDPVKFRIALEGLISNPDYRHKSARNALSYLFATPSPRRLNCSSLIAAAVLDQPESVFAATLRRLLDQRTTRDDVAPADLMRAVLALSLPVDGCRAAVVDAENGGPLIESGRARYWTAVPPRSE